LGKTIAAVRIGKEILGSTIKIISQTTMYKTPAPEDLLNVKGMENGLNQIKKVKIMPLSLL
jgi:hypothetical protein